MLRKRGDDANSYPQICRTPINDIDPARMTLRVRQGKGGKDRYAILSENLLTELRVYWKRYRPAVWLFSNRAKNGPLSRNEAWHIFNSAKKRAGLKKGRGIHSLRAMFCHSSVGSGCGPTLDPVVDGAHLAYVYPALLEAIATQRQPCP
ncbi:MAG: tyrosine-type recombinase/integrase [Pyrinomonadaceae bacterium]|nr:tyrosine-type recombinase/integrase [Pyrinomonadaceae bacterium]